MLSATGDSPGPWAPSAAAALMGWQLEQCKLGKTQQIYALEKSHLCCSDAASTWNTSPCCSS